MHREEGAPCVRAAQGDMAGCVLERERGSGLKLGPSHAGPCGWVSWARGAMADSEQEENGM